MSNKVSEEDCRAITQKKSHYARFADTKQWDKFRDNCLPDVSAEFYNDDGSLMAWGKWRIAFNTNHSFANFFDGFFTGKQSLHNLGPGEFEPGDAPDEVKSVFAMEDQIYIKSLGQWGQLRGGGFYYETWKKVDGEWKLKELRLRRTYQEMSWLFQFSMISRYIWGVTIF